MIFRFFIILLPFVILSCNKDINLSNNENSFSKKLDSLITISNNTKLTILERKEALKLSNKYTDKITNDSLKIGFLLRIAYCHLILGNIEDYGEINQIILSNSFNNISSQFEKALVYENLGYYYSLKFKTDSSFYYYNNALNEYISIKDKISEGRVLLSMASILSDVKDFTGSEISLIKSIDIFKRLNDFDYLYKAYNNLAVVTNQLKKYDESINYRKKSLFYISKLENKQGLDLSGINGIGVSYQEQEEWIKSIEYFQSAVSKMENHQISPKIYSAAINNLAYSKFKLGQFDKLPDLFYKALKIRDSLNIKDGQVTSNLHLSEYYLSLKDSLKAINYADKAYKISKEFNYNDGLLESYLLLSKIESPKKGVKYLQKYIQLSDSLQQQEREIREKFTRIAYETDEITKENKVITKKNWWLTIALIIGGGFFTVVYFYIRQRSKNKELLFNQKQEEANTEIYNLMISEKAKFQEGSVKERNRISEELHDNVVNKLFGTRLGLLVLNDKNTKEAINKREHHIETLQQIEEEIRTVSHELKVEKFNLDNTFEKMVEDLVIKQSKLTNFEWKLSFSEVTSWENISNKIKIHCYRTLQETLHNIHKYAEATEVEIKFFGDEKVLLVEIIDNGIGFNPSTKTNGIGLQNIQSRIAKLKGKVEIISAPGYGTKIRLKIPLCSKS